MSRETPTLPHPLDDADLIKLCKLFGEGSDLGLDDHDSLHLAVCQLAVELEVRTPPKTWADAIAIEPQLEYLRSLASLRPKGKAWADSAFFTSSLRCLVGPEARSPRLRDPAITKLVLDTITRALEV
ncbi:MAG: hypothetical protein U0836_09200 [Pirellulales bacterium]